MIPKKLHKFQSLIKQILVLASFLLVFIPDAYCGNHSTFPKPPQTEVISKNGKIQFSATSIWFIKNLKYVEDFKCNSLSDFAVLILYFNRSQNNKSKFIRKEYKSLKGLLLDSLRNYTSKLIYPKPSENHN